MVIINSSNIIIITCTTKTPPVSLLTRMKKSAHCSLSRKSFSICFCFASDDDALRNND